MTSKYVQQAIDVGILQFCSNDYAVKILTEYGAEMRSSRYIGFANEVMEQTLLERDDPAINIALAENATDRKILSALWASAKVRNAGTGMDNYAKALRLAVLSNEVCESSWITGFPDHILAQDELIALITTGDDLENHALFQNFKLNPNLLETLYGGTGIFDSIDIERRRRLVMASALNKRLVTDLTSDEAPDTQFWKIHEKIFQMLSTSPTSLNWVLALDQLVSSLNPFNLPSRDQSILPVLDRWKLVDDATEGLDTDLSMVDEFRCQVAAIYGSYWDKANKAYQQILDGSIDSDDIAVRCAYYGNAKLDLTAMETAYRRDGAIYVLAVMNNRAVLKNSALRFHFESEQLTEHLRHRYITCCNHLKSIDESFNPRPVSEWLMDTEAKGERSAVDPTTIKLNHVSEKLAAIEQKHAIAEKLLEQLKTFQFWGFVILAGLIWAKT